MDNIGIDFDMGGLFAGLDKLNEAVYHSLLASLFIAGEALRADSTQIVPFDKGFNGGLAGSSSTERAVDEGGGIISATVGYNMPYAARLHEDMTLHISQKHAGAGAARQQKYLEKPAKENAEKYGSILMQSFNDALS